MVALPSIDGSERVGVALQMLDDLTAVLLPDRHDKAGEDLRCGRPTWAWALAAQRCSQWQYHALAREARVDIDQPRDGAEAARDEVGEDHLAQWTEADEEHAPVLHVGMVVTRVRACSCVSCSGEESQTLFGLAVRTFVAHGRVS